MEMVVRVLLLLWGLLLLPVVLLTSLRLASTPLFACLEYHRPGFPADPYGLSAQDRELWCNRVLASVVGNEEVELLAVADLPARQRAPGRGNRAFCSRELRHLADVKCLFQRGLLVWRVSLGIFCLGLLLPRRAQTLRVASAVALASLVVGAMVGALGGEGLLTRIHGQFFEGNSYLFYTSDTLLRIYPYEYWRDFLIFVVIFGLLTTAAVLIASRARSNQPG